MLQSGDFEFYIEAKVASGTVVWPAGAPTYLHTIVVDA